jgi:urease accessory protein
VIARTHAVVEAGGVLGALRCEPPLTVRQVRSEEPQVCALCLVGTAAGPLPADQLTLELQVRPGARARLGATGASIAQGRWTPDGRAHTPARLELRVEIGEYGWLCADPGPLVVSQGSRVDVHVEIALGAGATVRWRELVVLGRSRDDHPGAATIRWDVTRQGHPVLRQYLDLADPQLLAWGGTIAGRRVMATELIADPQLSARTVIHSPTAVAQLLADGSVLATVLADDAADAVRTLDELCAAVTSVPPAEAQNQARPGSPASSANTVPSIRP